MSNLYSIIYNIRTILYDIIYINFNVLNENSNSKIINISMEILGLLKYHIMELECNNNLILNFNINENYVVYISLCNALDKLQIELSRCSDSEEKYDKIISKLSEQQDKLESFILSKKINTNNLMSSGGA